MSAEVTVVRNYIDWMLSLPWGEKTDCKMDLDEAEKILDEDHYGLKEPKERIVEYLAVQSLVKKSKGLFFALSALRASAKPRWQNQLPGQRAESLCGCLWAACGMRPKSAGIAEPISAPCRGKLCSA